MAYTCTCMKLNHSTMVFSGLHNNIVEPFYSRRPWDKYKFLENRGVLISWVNLYCKAQLGIFVSVLNTGVSSAFTVMNFKNKGTMNEWKLQHLNLLVRLLLICDLLVWLIMRGEGPSPILGPTEGGGWTILGEPWNGTKLQNIMWMIFNKDSSCHYLEMAGKNWRLLFSRKKGIQQTKSQH